MTERDQTQAGGSPLDGGVRPSLLTEKELLDIVDQLIRDRAYNRPAAVAIGMAVGAAVEAEVRESLREQLQEVQRLRAALEWYSGEARALAKNVASGTHTAAVLASVTVLALDAGRRADAALGPNVRGNADPTA